MAKKPVTRLSGSAIAAATSQESSDILGGGRGAPQDASRITKRVGQPETKVVTSNPIKTLGTERSPGNAGMTLEVRKTTTRSGQQIKQDLIDAISRANQDPQWQVRYYGHRLYISEETLRIKGWQKI